MKEKSLINSIKTILGINVSLESAKLEDGITVVEADAFAEGNEVFVVNGEDKVALPEGSYTLEDGKKMEVNAEGVITAITEANAEAPAEAPAEEPVEAPVEAEAEVPATATATPKKIIKTVTEEIHLAELKKLQDIIDEKEAKIVELSKVEAPEVTEEVQLETETPAVVHSPEVTAKKSILTIQKRANSTKERVWSSLFN